MKTIELLAPGGDIESIKAAILAGADAVYCGLDKFNARNRAANITINDLDGILRLAHQNHCRIFLTLNIIVLDSEIPALIRFLNKLVNTSIDGIIVQDLGLFYLLTTYYKNLFIHASTQLTTHNEGQIAFLAKLHVTRVNLSRELSLSEIKALTAMAHSTNMLTEVFVHGSYCLSFSGLCYMSSVHGGNSGNRGRCSQPCRDQYATTSAGKNFPLNLKDNSAFTDLKELAETGVDSLKIEGRIKKFHYVYTVVEAWRKQIDRLLGQKELSHDKSELYKVFNRDFSNGYLKGAIGKEMFIDNPRDNSAIHLSALHGVSTYENLEKAKGDVYDERTEIIQEVENKIRQLSAAKAPLIITISGESGNPLKVSVKTPDELFVVVSETKLAGTGTEVLDYGMLMKRLKALNETEYYIEQLELDQLQPNVYIPFKELTTIKNKLLFLLNHSREIVEPIAVPVLKKHKDLVEKPSLSVLISTKKDLYLSKETSAIIHFHLPNSFGNRLQEFTDLFTKNKQIIPWFPAVLIGEEFEAALELLHQVMPKRIVTNNTGIAFEAYKMGIDWVAGPYLNLTNSHSLLCLKENFNCSGAFISNELNRQQIKGIKKPDHFELYYSIYHPIVMMTSRQCLFHQVTGCTKKVMDESCIQDCNKTATLTNLKEKTLYLDKSEGNFNNIYNEENYLNTSVFEEVSGLFTGFCIDLRDVKTGTKTDLDKPGIIKLFEDLLDENQESMKALQLKIQPTTSTQYMNGIKDC